MFKDIDEYYALLPSTRKQLVRWFQFSSRVVNTLCAEEGYDEDQIIKLLRSIITKKNLKQLRECE